ncbi:MAG: AAA family ATPase [Treponema sp.]|jgi:CO dehydrogenase maturation factor|nr:AAA family ATPase [Treponema sp.]
MSTNRDSKLIAVTGKGGVGKTTVSALLIKNLLAAGKSPVLAIDADPNSCLDAALGVCVTETVGRAREETRASSGTGANISKRELLRIKLEQGLVEAEGFDLIAMGRPEGEGCYCYANNILKDIIAEISSQYPYVVLDNEAGLENLSRRIVQKVDTMVLTSDGSNAGLQTLLRLHELAGEMALSYGKLALVINRLRGDKLPGRMDEIREKTKADLIIGLPDNEEITAFAEISRSFLEISDSNPVYEKIRELLMI